MSDKDQPEKIHLTETGADQVSDGLEHPQPTSDELLTAAEASKRLAEMVKRGDLGDGYDSEPPPRRRPPNFTNDNEEG